MRPASLVPDPAVVTLEEIVADAGAVTRNVRTCRWQVCCPVCGQLARRAHSWYTRHLADLPWQGLRVAVRLRMRRWFCDNPYCARRIFTERVPTVAAPHGRRTQRLAAVVEAVAFALGGEPGARLLAALGLALSPDTLRRAVGHAALPAAATPRVFGWTIGAYARGGPLARSLST